MARKSSPKFGSPEWKELRWQEYKAGFIRALDKGIEMKEPYRSKAELIGAIMTIRATKESDDMTREEKARLNTLKKNIVREILYSQRTTSPRQERVIEMARQKIIEERGAVKDSRPGLSFNALTMTPKEFRQRLKEDEAFKKDFIEKYGTDYVTKRKDKNGNFIVTKTLSDYLGSPK